MKKLKPTLEITNVCLENLFNNYKTKLIELNKQEWIEELEIIYLLFDEKDKTETTFIHGDFHGENMVINEKFEITGIIDWEENILGFRYFDIFEILNYMLIVLKMSNSEDKYDRLKNIFIQEYENHCDDGFKIDENKLLHVREFAVFRKKVFDLLRPPT